MPKYALRTPRYINGQYVHAAANDPAIIELPEGTKVDAGLEPLDEGGKPLPKKLAPAHVSKPGGGVPLAAERTAPTPHKADASAKAEVKTGTRAADKSVI